MWRVMEEYSIPPLWLFRRWHVPLKHSTAVIFGHKRPMSLCMGKGEGMEREERKGEKELEKLRECGLKKDSGQREDIASLAVFAYSREYVLFVLGKEEIC